MDLLSQHESFLRAIFDAPDDDTARLVYADFLQENGEEDRAEFIRVQCELARLESAEREPDWYELLHGRDEAPLQEHYERLSLLGSLRQRSERLEEQVIPWRDLTYPDHVTTSRGFWHEATESVAISGKGLDDPRKFREWVVRVNPVWYGEKKLVVPPGSRLSPEHIRTLCELPFIRQVTDWNLAGHIDEVRPYAEWSDEEKRSDDFDFIPMAPGTYHRSVITTAGVNVLTRHRGASRIASLDLRNNNLDNDAARALAQSPYLDNLKQLLFLQGNDVSGKVWQKVIERFGEDVAG